VTTTMQMPLLYTTEEFANALGIQTSSLRRALARKSLPAPDGYLGRTPYWYYDTVEAALQKRSKS
jgi:hypothetical protein